MDEMQKTSFFASAAAGLEKSDPEFAELFARFASEAGAFGEMDERTESLAVLATLIGCQGTEAFCGALSAALKRGVSPVEVKEIVYQATAYLGFGRALPFLRATNEALAAQGTVLPLAGQTTIGEDERLSAGVRTQTEIFGAGMQEFYRSGPEDTVHINRWLAENCFGDYYTRGGLDDRQRELITFCFLAAQGGCEPQLKSHVAANLRIGNDKRFLIAVVSRCLPYIGYPRSLNAIACIRAVAEQEE